MSVRPPKSGPRRRRRQLPARRGVVRAAIALLLLVVVTVLVVGLAALRQHAESSAAARDSAAYTPPPLSTPEVVTNSRGPGVTVVGDDLSTGPGGTSNALWTTLIQRDLSVPVTTLAAVGSGYVASPDYGASRTYVDSARLAVARSDAIVFFGGANDAGTPALTEIKAATDAVSEARTSSPGAQIFIVGPAWPTTDPPQSVLAVRDALRSAARSARVTWVDPIEQRWLNRSGGLLSSDGVTLTDAGQTAVAARFRQLLASAVR